MPAIGFDDKTYARNRLCGQHSDYEQKICQEYKKLEDLKVLRRSPDLLNNVKIGQG